MRGQVFFIDQAARRASVVGDRAGQFAAIKVLTSAARDGLERLGLPGTYEAFAGIRCTPARCKGLGESWHANNLYTLPLPLTAHDRRNHPTIARISDGGFEELCE